MPLPSLSPEFNGLWVERRGGTTADLALVVDFKTESKHKTHTVNVNVNALCSCVCVQFLVIVGTYFLKILIYYISAERKQNKIICTRRYILLYFVYQINNISFVVKE